jgi:hypothetical protein
MFERLQKMDRRTILALVAASILGIVIFGAIAGGIRQAGWNEGFLVGLLAGDGESGVRTVAPYLANRGYGHGWHHGGVGFFGGLFRFFFFAFLVILFLKFVGFWRWRRQGHHGWHGRHGWQGHGPWGPGGPQGTPWPQSNPPQPTPEQPKGTPSQSGASNLQNVVWL